MVNWSQSHFLQSLGWATLNSFWQMALLWCVYVAANSVFQLSSQKKYQLSVSAVMGGFVWFLFTFFSFYATRSTGGIAFFQQTISESNDFLNIFLLSASVAYLSLLVFPACRLIRNWRFVQQIKKQGLQKAGFNYRLFVQKISSRLCIQRKVFVYLSDLVTSPVTVGYLKPIILLPVAALNNLSVQQVEAILLHELSHIRRYDYIVNFMINIISTFLYFNPFVKFFIRNIEEERENCCDQLVLQFGYDKLSYASALLTLQKISIAQPLLAIGAAGKNYLLSRIEKIVGLPASQRQKKKELKRNRFVGLLAALLCIVAFNSILIIRETKREESYVFNELANPLNLFSGNNGKPKFNSGPGVNNLPVHSNSMTSLPSSEEKYRLLMQNGDAEQNPTLTARMHNGSIMHAEFDVVDASLTKEQKEKVKNTVDATKKVLTGLQWLEAENAIGDVLTEKEKLLAKKQYSNEIEKTVNWKNIEQNMKAQYENIDWQKINTNVQNAMISIQLDSLQKTYTLALNELNKLAAEAIVKTEISVCPLPDQSMEKIRQSKEELSRRVNTIKAMRSSKKVVRL